MKKKVNPVCATTHALFESWWNKFAFRNEIKSDSVGVVVVVIVSNELCMFLAVALNLSAFGRIVLTFDFKFILLLYKLLLIFFS